MHAFDRQTDGQTDRILIADRVCILCSAVKTNTLINNLLSVT